MPYEAVTPDVEREKKAILKPNMQLRFSKCEASSCNTCQWRLVIHTKQAADAIRGDCVINSSSQGLDNRVISDDLRAAADIRSLIDVDALRRGDSDRKRRTAIANETAEKTAQKLGCCNSGCDKRANANGGTEVLDACRQLHFDVCTSLRGLRVKVVSKNLVVERFCGK